MKFPSNLKFLDVLFTEVSGHFIKVRTEDIKVSGW